MDSISSVLYQYCDTNQVYVFKRKDSRVYMKTYDIFMKFLRKTNISPELQRTLFIPVKDSQEKIWGAFTLGDQLCAPSLESIQDWIKLLRQAQFSAPVEKLTIGDHPEWPLCHIKQLSSGHLIAGTWMKVVISNPKQDFEIVQDFNKNINHPGNYRDCCELSNGDLITAFTGSKLTDKEGKVIQNAPSSLDLWRFNGKSFEHQRLILEDNRDFPAGMKANIPSVVELQNGLIAAPIENDIKFWDPKLDYKCVKTVSHHVSNKIHCMIHANGYLVSASDKSLKIYDIKEDWAEEFHITDKPSNYQNYFIHSGRIRCLLELSDRRLIAGTENGLMLGKKDVKEGWGFQQLKGTPFNVSQILEFSSGIIACVAGGRIYLLDPSQQFQIKTSYKTPLHLPPDSDSLKDYIFHGERILELEDGKWIWGHTAGKIYILTPTSYPENLFPIDKVSEKKLLEIAPKISTIAEKTLLYERIIASNPYCWQAHYGRVQLCQSEDLRLHFLLRAATYFLGKHRGTTEEFIRQANLLAKKSTNLGIQRRLLNFLTYLR